MLYFENEVLILRSVSRFLISNCQYNNHNSFFLSFSKSSKHFKLFCSFSVSKFSNSENEAFSESVGTKATGSKADLLDYSILASCGSFAFNISLKSAGTVTSHTAELDRRFSERFVNIISATIPKKHIS